MMILSGEIDILNKIRLILNRPRIYTLFYFRSKNSSLNIYLFFYGIILLKDIRYIMNSINNRILIAMPHMDSPYFKESVIFMCEHNNDGAMGLIVNKPLDDQILEKVLVQLNVNSNETFQPFSDIYFGGPVMFDRGILLHKYQIELYESVKLSDNFYLSSDKKAFKSIAENPDNKSRFFLGHSGWSNGQLESEIENGDWIVQETSPEFIFDVPEDKMWIMALQSFGIEISNFSTFGGKA
jgi:putative transcriptional regulator